MTVVQDARPEVEPVPAVGAPALDALVLPRVNLLPPEIAELARFRRVQAALAGGLVATVGVVGVLYAGATASVADATEELGAATARGASLQADARAFADVNDVYAQAATAQAMLSSAMGEEVRFSTYLDALSKTVPEHVWLKNVTFTQAAPAGAAPVGVATATPGIGTATFTGVGFRHDDVATWLETLAAQDGFTDPYVSDAVAGKIGERRTVSFTSTVTLTSDALSGRYSTEGS